jgi:UDP:flavonoid glycosyltransferase YjiC (YdhE family)
MADVVVGSSSITGQVDPMLSIAAHLRGAGHTVRILTGSRFAERVAATRAEFVPLQAAADFDDTDLDAAFPGR